MYDTEEEARESPERIVGGPGAYKGGASGDLRTFGGIGMARDGLARLRYV